MPWEDSILSVDSEFYSKLKDVAVKKTQKAADKDNNLVIIDAQALESMVHFEKASLSTLPVNLFSLVSFCF